MGVWMALSWWREGFGMEGERPQDEGAQETEGGKLSTGDSGDSGDEAESHRGSAATPLI
jgi:hypothetical protein